MYFVYNGFIVGIRFKINTTDVADIWRIVCYLKWKADWLTDLGPRYETRSLLCHFNQTRFVVHEIGAWDKTYIILRLYFKYFRCNV
jgi:hypothetical protein